MINMAGKKDGFIIAFTEPEDSVNDYSFLYMLNWRSHPMKRSPFRIVAVPLILGVWITTGGLTHAAHVHNAHPTTNHGTEDLFQRILLENGPGETIEPTLDFDEENVIIDDTTFNCNTNPATVGYSFTTSRKHTVVVSGSVEVGGAVEAEAGAFFAKLKALASANVTMGSSWTGEYDESVVVSSSTSLDPGKSIRYYKFKRMKTASGMGMVYDHKIVCECMECHMTYETFCNETWLSGTGTGFLATVGGWETPQDYECASP